MENSKIINEKLDRLIEILCSESKNFNASDFKLDSKNYDEKLKVFNSLALSRNNTPLSGEFLKLQNDVLSFENSKRKIVNADDLTYTKNMAIYVGDIRNIKADAIVCGGKDAFTEIKSEKSLSNKVLLSGGLQIRQELNFVLPKNNEVAPNGLAQILKAYNLPSNYIIYTVGPRIKNGKIGFREKEDLVNCYKACLNLALSKNFETVVFSCISTGGKSYPKKLASEIAVCTVSFWLKANKYPFKVVFCVYDDETKGYYESNFEDYVED